MADYDVVKKGKLKLKGGKTLSNVGGTNERKKRKRHHNTDDSTVGLDSDTVAHGGWWSIKQDNEVRGGPVAIETRDQFYLMAMDNGKFTIGAPHAPGDPPSPEEIFSLIRTPDSRWVALKSGFGKYVGVDTSGQVVAVTEAVGARERWEPVFQEEKMAIQCLGNNCFLSCETDKEGHVFASSSVARDNEFIQLRTNMEREKPQDYTPAEDKKSSEECELAYRKMYQHSKIDLNPNDRSYVKKAKEEGTLHETLLDRRVKMKHDKYC